MLSMTHDDPDRPRRNPYEDLALRPEDAEGEGYMRLLGGGPAHWDRRGAFQIALLKELGLLPHHRFADYGCGPIRGGRHIIGYLDPGGYDGYDFNKDFIAIAERLVRDHADLSEKRPGLFWTEKFLDLAREYDFILFFSVLNHCGAVERERTLDLARALGPRTRFVVTHGRWFERLDEARRSGLTQRRIARSDLPDGFDLATWGWPDGEEKVFPIYVLSGAER